MTSTVWITVPIATITVDEPAPSTTSPDTLTSTSDQSLLASGSSAFQPTDTFSSEQSASRPILPQPTLMNTTPESLPTVLLSTTQSTGFPTAAIVSTSQTSSIDQPSESAASVPTQTPQRHKNAIIGGLVGAIAAALLTGVLICLLLRWRRLRKQNAMSSHLASEKGPSPMFFASQISRINGVRDSPASYGQRRAQEVLRDSVVIVDEHHRIIRMSTVHWPRPYAPGEGYRESVPPGVLRVVNPDRSLPPTPGDASTATNRGRASSIASFMRRQKLVAGNENTECTPRSRASSHSVAQWPLSSSEHANSQNHKIPIITIDPALSQELMPSRARTASIIPQTTHMRPVVAHIVDSRSLTPSSNERDSIASSLIVQQRPPEDPFCAPRAVQSLTHGSEAMTPGTITIQPLDHPQHHTSIGSGRTDDSVSLRPGATQVNYSYTFRPHDAPTHDVQAEIPRPESSTTNTNAMNRYTSDSEILRSHMKFPLKRQTLDDQQPRQSWARRSDPFDLDRASMRFSDLFPHSAATADGRAPGRSVGRLSNPKDKEIEWKIASLSSVQMYEGT